MKKVCAIFGVFLLFGILQGQIPQVVSYQGLLTDTTGTVVVDGSYSFTFRLYDVNTGGTALWTENKSLGVNDGIFNTYLGDTTPFSNAMTWDETYYLGIAVGADPEMSPRIELASVPYSLKAMAVEGSENVFPDSGYIGIGTKSPNGMLDIRSIGNASSTYSLATQNSRGDTTLVVRDNGKIGIGTNAPTQQLEVVVTGYDIAKFRTSAWYGSINVVSPNTTTILQSADTYAIVGTQTSTDFHIVTGGGTKAIIESSGDVGIGTTNPGYKLEVNGTTWCTAGSWAGSDMRWKQNISTLEGSLDKVGMLRGVYYNWRRKEFPGKNFPSSRQVGLIAQEVEMIIPEVVTTNPEGYKGIDYEKLVPFLIEAVKELKAENEKMKKEIKSLKEMVRK